MGASKQPTKKRVPSVAPAAGSYRNRMRTLVDEDALETARLASLHSSTPPKGAASSSSRPAEPIQLAALARVPVLAVARTRLAALSVSSAAGFLLGFVDGASSLEAIAEMSGFSASDVVSEFAKLRKEGVVVFQ